MKWTKLGRIFRPPSEVAWSRSHATAAVPDPLGGSAYRVYFSSRDGQQRTRIGCFDLDLSPPGTVLGIGPEPVVDLGALGSFDDSGVTSACVVNHEGRKYFYYTGWSLGVSVPFYLYIGLAVSSDGGRSFRRESMAPVLGRSRSDPYLTASPAVLVEQGRFRMWYVSGSRWELDRGRPKHYYNIRYAESDDGIHWEPSGRVCIDYASPAEHAISRPCVLRDADRYRMWYACRGETYRIGYAESADGLSWKRHDAQAGIDVSEEGWDSEMIAYPFVFDHGGRRYMLYNGNGYGETGIGLAVLDA
jgi:hypothetical protein